MKFSRLLITSASAIFACSAVYAATVNFPVGQSNGSFNCTLSNPSATVKIDTIQLDLDGACAGSPHVVSNGHLSGVPSSIIQNYYFQITKHLTSAGQVTVTASEGDITCATGHGAKGNVYGDGRYCLKNTM